MKKETNDCCLKFDPVPFDRKTHRWKNRLFIRDTLPQLFHMPLPFMVGRMIQRLWNKARKADAAPDLADFLWLAYDPSPWRAEHFIYVTKEVPDAENVKISGTFVSMVFDGPYNSVPKWIKELNEYLTSKGKMSKKTYFYFTTCPKCAKKYGHNYVVAFAQVG